MTWQNCKADKTCILPDNPRCVVENNHFKVQIQNAGTWLSRRTVKSSLNFTLRITAVTTDCIFIVTIFKIRNYDPVSTNRLAGWKQSNLMRFFETLSADTFQENAVKDKVLTGIACQTYLRSIRGGN